MFSYSCPSCSQRLLAPTEKAGTKTICPKCLKPLTVPAHDRMAAIDLESVIEPTHAEISLASAGTDSLSSDTGSAPRDYLNAVDFYPPRVLHGLESASDIDLDGDQNTSSEVADCETTPTPTASIKSFTPLPAATATAFNRKPLASDHRGMVNLTPTGLFSVDMVAQISATLSMRMSPPPENGSEGRVTIGAWSLVTVAAIVVWIAGVFLQPEWFLGVAILGVAMIAFGYVWRAHLVGRNGRTLQGLLALLPPVNAIAQLKSTEGHGHRPLRFVLAGVAVLGLFVLGYDTHNATAAAFKQAAPKIPPPPPAGIAETIRDYADRAKDDQLLRYVRELPFSAAYRSAGLEEKAAANEQLVKLTNSPRAELREVAFATLVACSPDDARKVILTVLRGASNRDYALALTYADRVATPEIAVAAVERLGDPTCGVLAEIAVRKIGPTAEPGLIAQLGNEKMETVLTVCELLGKVGTAKSLKPLQQLAESAENDKVKAAANRALKAVGDREPQPPPEKVSAVPPAPPPPTDDAAFARRNQIYKCVQ